MTLSTKDLKEKVFDADPKLTELYNNKIDPLVNIIREKKKEIDRLFQIEPTPENAPTITVKYKKITEEIKKANKKLLSVISDIERDYHIKLDRRLSKKLLLSRELKLKKIWDADPDLRYNWRNNFEAYIENLEITIGDKHHSVIGGTAIDKIFPHEFIDGRRVIEGVECLFINNELHRETLLGACISCLEKDTAEYFIRDDLLFLQINLTYDKNEILDLCDDAISKAQSIIGKTNKRAKKAEIERLFDLFFKYHYQLSKSKSDALDKVVKDFKTVGFQIEAETLDKKYIHGFKKRCRITDVRQLKGGYGIKQASPHL